MNKWILLLWIGASLMFCSAREPFKPRAGSVQFVVYFNSRYRGLCVGFLVSRTAVLTALVCVTNPLIDVRDTRPINVVTGTSYRHPRRGIRVQVAKILIPNMQDMAPANRGYTMSKSCAVLLLKRQIPDVLVEVPLRPIAVDYIGEEVLSIHDECFSPGWHFFYKGDKVLPGNKFLLQRNLRVQYLNVARRSMWCEPLVTKLQKALGNLGFTGSFDKTASICVRDPDKSAQPCHGMYGTPLICKGKAVGMMTAPDAQWSNCTGFSNLYHLFAGKYHSEFMDCISRLFIPEGETNWDSMQRSLRNDTASQEYDPLPEIYGRVGSQESSSSEEF